MNWIKYLALCLPLTLVLVGCTPKDTAKTESTETTETTTTPAEDDAVKTEEAAAPADKAAEKPAETSTETKTEKTVETKKAE